MTRLALSLCLLCLVACTQQDKEHARTQANKLDTTVKADAQRLKQDLQKGMNGSTNSTAEAGRKLDHASILARVKTRLASEAGLSTLTNVNVDVNRDSVTLRGTATSEDQKRMAGEAAAQVDGVRHVNNEIRVQP